MFKTNLKPRRHVVGRKKAMRSAAFAFFFLSIIPTQGQTNVVSGTAYGTNDLSEAASITSIEDGAGTLLIGFSGTTNINLQHDITGFIVVTNRTADFSIEAINASVTSAGGTALAVINTTNNLSLTGGRYVGTTDTGGGDSPSAALGGLLRNSKATIDGSEFTGAAGNAGMTIQSSELEVTDGTFIGGLNAVGLLAVSNSTVTIDSGSVTGRIGMYVQSSDLTINDGIFSGGDNGAALYAISNSVVTITNGIFTGGINSAALYVSDGILTNKGGIFIGGDNAEGLYAKNSDVTIEGGTFTGGTNAAALYDSNVTIEDGTFTGGANAAALFARNSDLIINGGTFQGGSFETNSYFGLVSIADATQTNNITLNGGTFNSIDFAGSGVQFLTAGAGLQVDGDMVLDGGALIVDNASSSAFQNLWIRSGDMQLNDYALSADGILKFLIISNSYGNLTVDTASFESNATVDVDATLASFDTGTNDVVLVSTTTGIISLDSNANLTASTIGRIVLSDAYVGGGGSNLVFEFTTQPLKDYWNATGVFGEFSEELDSLITPEMNTTINLINDPEISSRAVEQTYFTTFNTLQTAINGIRAAVGQSVARATELRDQQRRAPRGARGPRRRRGQQPDSQIRGWGKYYGNYYTRSESGLYPSYESGLHGGVLGIDASIGKLIVGISGGAGRYETTFNNDASENTSASYGSLYSTYGAERGYIDAGIAYGINQVETRTADPFRLDGDFDAQVVNVYFGGGYDLTDTRGGTVFTPEASIQYAKYKQDGYTETGTAAVPRVFDEFDADSLLSSIGINVAMQERQAMKTVAFQLDGRLHWMHEFNAESSDTNFMLVGGSNQYLLNYPSLDEEIYRIGVGCSFFNTGRRKPNNVVFRVDFDELFGDGFNSHNLSAKLIYAF